MGAGSTLANILLFLSALERVLRAAGYRVRIGERRGRGRRSGVVRRRVVSVVRRSGRARARAVCAVGVRLRGLHLPHAARRASAADAAIPRRPRSSSCARAKRARAGRDAAARAAMGAYARMSPNLKRAVLVAEDDAFWQHEGMDFEQLQESMEVELERVEFARGGSTITQQLAKNLYLSPSKNPMRKLRELLIARRLEAELSKPRILELYLNVIEWGDGIYGAEAAARTLFPQVRRATRAPRSRRCSRPRSVNPRAARIPAIRRRACAAAADDPAAHGRASRRRRSWRGPVVPPPPAAARMLSGAGSPICRPPDGAPAALPGRAVPPRRRDPDGKPTRRAPLKSPVSPCISAINGLSAHLDRSPRKSL